MPDKFMKFTLLLLVALDSMLASPVAKSDDTTSDAKREAVKEDPLRLALRHPAPQYNQGVPPQGGYQQNPAYVGGYPGGYQQNPGYVGGYPGGNQQNPGYVEGYPGGNQQNPGYVGGVPYPGGYPQYPDYGGVPYPGGYNQQYPDQSGVIVGGPSRNPYPTYYGDKNDVCGIQAYRAYYGQSPCDGPRYGDYFKVVYNSYSFVQCGSGNIPHCKQCGPGTEWDQSLLTCGGLKSGYSSAVDGI